MLTKCQTFFKKKKIRYEMATAMCSQTKILFVWQTSTVDRKHQCQIDSSCHLDKLQVVSLDTLKSNCKVFKHCIWFLDCEFSYRLALEPGLPIQMSGLFNVGLMPKIVSIFTSCWVLNNYVKSKTGHCNAHLTQVFIYYPWHDIILPLHCSVKTVLWH